MQKMGAMDGGSDSAKSQKMWSEFVVNMVPVITRVVKFCKLLPGEIFRCFPPSICYNKEN